MRTESKGRALMGSMAHHCNSENGGGGLPAEENVIRPLPTHLGSQVRIRRVNGFLGSIQELVLGSRLCLLLVALPFALLAQLYNFRRSWIFALSLLGLAPLAERSTFLIGQIANHAGPTVGGALKAACGNAAELIIALSALQQGKLQVVKYYLLGSIISSLLLVLGTCLLSGGIANLKGEQRFDRKQIGGNMVLLMHGLLCLVLPLVVGYAIEPENLEACSVLKISRANSVLMVVAYASCLFFESHRKLLETQNKVLCDGDGRGEEVEDGGNILSQEEEEEVVVVGFWIALVWLLAMTSAIAWLSLLVLNTIESVSYSWGTPVSFVSAVLLPLLVNTAAQAGPVRFALENKLDVPVGVALGSATQISLFVVPFCVIVGWMVGVPMDLDFSLLETASLALSVVLIFFTLQDGTSHYMKGVVLCISYVVIVACFFVHGNVSETKTIVNPDVKPPSGGA